MAYSGTPVQEKGKGELCIQGTKGVPARGVAQLEFPLSMNKKVLRERLLNLGNTH